MADKDEKKKELKIWFMEWLDEYTERGLIKCPSCKILFKLEDYPECPKCGASWDKEKKAWITKVKEEKKNDVKTEDEDDNGLF